MDQRRQIVAAAALLLMTGCGSSGSASSDHVPSVRRISIAELPIQPPHPEPVLEHVAVAVDPMDPSAIALSSVIESLVAQGLRIVDTGTTVLASSGERITIRVLATHSDGTGVMQTSLYDVDLDGDLDGRWAVRTMRPAE